MFLKRAIKKRKAVCTYARIEAIDGTTYYLCDEYGKTFQLHFNFIDMKQMPGPGDGFYMSENIINGMKENCYSYTFSTRIGECYAREPHDFKKNPEEFLICEYKNGKTILLEQWYG